MTAWTANRINKFLNNTTAGDAMVQEGYNGPKPMRASFDTFKEYLKAATKADGYICTDAYREGMKFWGKTPKAAAIAAGFTPLEAVIYCD